jgi:hypothetical protein
MYSKEEAKTLRNDFWLGFRKYTNRRRMKQKRSGKWILTRTGINAMNLKFHIDREIAQVGIDLETGNMEKRLELFEKLEATRSILEQHMQEPMNWELEYIRENGKSISRICVQLDEVDLYDPSTWKKVYRFFFEKMDALETYFTEYKDYLRYG